MKISHLLTGILLVISLGLVSCGPNKEEIKAKSGAEAQTYLDGYNTKFQGLLAEAAEAEWAANTRIVEGDTATANWVQRSGEAMSAYTGSAVNIETAKKYLADKSALTDLQIKQFEAILYMAGANPETAGEAVSKLITANAEQTANLYGYKFSLDGKEITTNAIDKILQKETNLDKRLAAWEASKQVGVGLKDGLTNLRGLRNQTVQALGYDNFFAYQASDYGYSQKELMDVCNNMVTELWPLYRELHTWARYNLAEKYKKDVPEMLPAHWLPNRWGQEWNALVQVDGVDLDGILSEKDAEWIMRKGEEFYVSLGLPPLPKSFYEKSSLYPAPESATYSKNNHASAWHMNNAEDVRSLMSVQPNTKWWGTVLHELGHIYYYIEYSNPDVPIILRGGANRAYHEGLGTMMGLAAMQVPFLQGLDLLPQELEVDKIQLLLQEALDYVVVIPWGAGVMTEFEHDLYGKNLSPDEFNKRWWELKKKWQGIVPPYDRGEEFCDAASKTHINNDAAQYYDYAMSTTLLFQFHNHIAKNILKQDPHATNYWGNKEIGVWLHDLMSPGASVDWKEHLKKSIGEDVSARAMLEYFEPLMDYLKEQNKGREHALPVTPGA